MANLMLDVRSGCWYRPDGTDDLDIIREGRSVYGPLPLAAGDRVLDLGAHIGTFVRRALDAGAASVVAVEPEAENLAVLARNGDDPRVTIIPAAVTDRPGPVVLYVNQGKGKCMHSIVTKGRKVPVEVPGVTLEQLLDDHQPNVLKVDVECAEYRLRPLRDLTACVKVLVMELHLNGKMRDAGMALAELIVGQGFRAVRAPVFTRANWHTVPIWQRD